VEGATTHFLLDGMGLRFRCDRQDGSSDYLVRGFSGELLAVFLQPPPAMEGAGGGGVDDLQPLVWVKNDIHGFGQLLCEETPLGTTYLQVDPVGGTTLLTDGDGTLVGIQKDLPFGERFGAVGLHAPLRFGIHEDQPGSPIYMKARMYLPAYGRFNTPDPGSDQATYDPGSWNLYGYVANNPLIYQDPWGMAKRKAADGHQRYLALIERIHQVERLMWECDDEEVYKVYEDERTRAWFEIGVHHVPETWWGTHSDFDMDTQQSVDYWPIYQAAHRQGTEFPEGPSGPWAGSAGLTSSVWDSLRAIGGVFIPSNWNTASMQRLYELGPLGQAERISPAAYRATAGSLMVSGVAVTAAGGLIGAEIAGLTDLGSASLGYQAGEVTFTRIGTGSKDLRINPLGDWGNANPESRMPHWHYRPGPGVPGHGIGRHLPWHWFK